MTGLVTAWLAEVVLISYRATKSGTNEGTANVPLPLPSQYAATFIVFGALALLPPSGATFAATAGWGFVLATFLNLYNPIKKGATAPTVAKPGTTTAVGNIAA